VKLMHLTAARALAVLAAVIAVAIGTTAAVAASAGSASAAPACSASHLRVWIGLPGDGAAGSVAYELQISNVSKVRCSLFGYPGVSAVNNKGSQLGSAAARDHTFAAKTVTLFPGRTAHFLLKITDVLALPPATCKPANAAGLRVFPPNTAKSSFVPLAFKACSKKGPRYLSTRVVRPQAGIPGFSQ
jgi:Domain of unknown function (DUF4232)